MQNIKKIFIPIQNSESGLITLKIIYDNDNVYVGIGDDDWVIKNGLQIGNPDLDILQQLC